MDANHNDTIEDSPLVPYVEEPDYPQDLRPILERYVSRMGFLPNALRLYMHRPEIASTLWALNDKVMRDPSSQLSVALKRRLAAVASKTNGCAYCTAHNCEILKSPGGFAAEGWDVSHEELTDLLAKDGTPADDFEAVCFDFVRAASFDPTAVPDEIYGRLTEQLKPAQVIELSCLVGFWKMYNTIHDSLRVPIESALASNTRYLDAAP